MMLMLTDTPNDVAELHAKMYRELPLERKLAIIDSMYRGGRELADLGLRLRNPNATRRECLENWVRLTIPSELVQQALEEVVDTAESAAAEVRHFARLVARLNIEILLGGSVAASMYTNARNTQDADVSVAPFPGREGEVVDLLADEYIVSLSAVESAVRRRRTFNAIRKATTFKIDVFIDQGRPYDQAARQRRKALPPEFPGDATVYVQSAEDVILHKLAWYRLGNEVADRQWADVLGIARAQRGHLDESYLGHWGSELGVADLWQRAKSELNQPNVGGEGQS
jgi:hypothetical protein